MGGGDGGIAQNNTPKSSGVALIACVLYLPFMIADLVLGYSNNYLCIFLVPTSVDFSLGTWLLVDGYGRLIMLIFSILFFVTLIACAAGEKVGGVIAIVGLYFGVNILYSLFNFCWLVVGAVMFWGAIAPSGLCEPSIQAYMYILLIVNFLGIFVNVFCSRSNQQQAV